MRSRNYPVISLSEAVEKARKLYDQENKAPTDQRVAVKAWGYSSLNGRSLRMLAALRQYGLLTDVGDRVKVSDDALAILLEPMDSPERIDTIRRAATAPAIFSELNAEYGDTLPSDDALAAYLVRKKGFQEDGARALIPSYRGTVEFAKQAGAGYIQPQEEDRPQETKAPIKKVGNRMPGSLEYSMSLPGDRTATLLISGPLAGDKELKLLNRWLDLTKELLADAVQAKDEEAK
ncbi:MAG TPA: hypothetical protein VMC86_12575 [Gemmatimonadales bacterium]|nr:hypothetical protein [Gemmatimonadales bacterium]